MKKLFAVKERAADEEEAAARQQMVKSVKGACNGKLQEEQGCYMRTPCNASLERRTKSLIGKKKCGQARA